MVDLRVVLFKWERDQTEQGKVRVCEPSCWCDTCLVGLRMVLLKWEREQTEKGKVRLCDHCPT